MGVQAAPTPALMPGAILRGVRSAEEEEQVAAPNTAITYILPDEGWAPLLEIIVREAPAQSVIEVNTAGMQALAERMLGEVDRQDVTVELKPPRGMASAQTAGWNGHERDAQRTGGLGGPHVHLRRR